MICTLVDEVKAMAYDLIVVVDIKCRLVAVGIDFYVRNACIEKSILGSLWVKSACIRET